jgi:cytochrome P450
VAYTPSYIPSPCSLANAGRAIHNDPELYDRPDEFLPERYEQSPLGFKPDVDDATDGIRKTYAFGAGRRICPGSHLAESSLVRVPLFSLLLLLIRYGDRGR